MTRPKTIAPATTSKLRPLGVRWFHARRYGVALLKVGPACVRRLWVRMSGSDVAVIALMRTG